ncbi:MAG: propionate--CoA ligase [Candidatus Lambdaproteobacteria bacterium]|nr:propionate--CoA ligase [Candidatus Lambdaproteobacteria bacterium]
MAGRYEQFFRRSIEDKEAFWAEQAESIHWHRKWDRVLNYDHPPFARWYEGGETNMSYNCIDRHIAQRGDQLAVVAISTETGQTVELTYRQLLEQVQRYAAVLQDLGVKQGDRVIIYLPMIHETLVAMQAVVRLGAIHSVVFGGFAPHNLATRIDDARPAVLITADGGMRGGKPVPYKGLVDAAIKASQHPPRHVLLIRRGLPIDVPWTEGRDLDFKALAEAKAGAKVDPVWVEANHPLYILYTSGTTGKPKGVQRDTGGHTVGLTVSMRHIYGVNPGETMFTTSDFGWTVGHSYIAFGPLLNGNTTIVYEGTPIKPDPGIWWKIVSERKVSVMFTAPTVARMLRKEDSKYLRMHDIGCLRYLFLAGEPLDEPSYHWLKDNLKKVVIDHYWQTESGWPMLANCAGLDLLPVKPGSPTKPVYGWDLHVVDQATGKLAPPGGKGVLIARPPLPPGSLATVWGDDKRFVESYFSTFKELLYYSGDYAIRDKDGYFYVLGRADEVINIAAHRLGTREIEEAISGHPAVAEAAAVGVHDELKGQAVVAFVVLKNGVTLTADQVSAEIKKQVDDTVGPIARPKAVHVVKALPKTRSGKVIRRAMIAMAEGRDVGDLSTLEDESAIEGIGQAIKSS